MHYRPLGHSGLKVSAIGFGAWAIGGSWGPQNDQDSLAALHQAIDQGVNLIDTAAGYGNGKSEQLIAQVLAERSEQVYVATKTPPLPGSWPPSPYDLAEDRYPASYLRQNVEERLRNLRTDCLDLLQLHTWTRAWNKNPTPFDVLRTLQAEGTIRTIGVSTPEHDQNSVIDLMRNGYVDAVQVIYNIFEQEPAAELLPAAAEHGVGILVRVVFDEGVLAGNYTANTRFAEGDFRNNYFAGDRLARAVQRVDQIKAAIAPFGISMPQAALQFALAHPAVSTVIPGIRNGAQAAANTAAADAPPLPHPLLATLREHAWLRSFWYAGK